MSPFFARSRALGLIVRRSLRQHLLSTAITVLSTALAAGLVMSVFAVHEQSRRAFAGGPLGFDAVLGARGSQLQLVLNAVFHLETSPGNIPWSLYREIATDPRVELALPYAVGDNFQGSRIVGTTRDVFDKFEFQRGQRFQVRPGGRPFDAGRREAVIGSFVARESGLELGDHFQPAHGVSGRPGEPEHPEEYVVVGILETTSSPSDRVIWIPIEGVFRMGGHVLRGSGEEFEARAGAEIPDEHKEVSAVLLKLRGSRAGLQLANLINRQGKEATMAWPIARVMSELFNKLGWVQQVLQLVAWLVVVVAAGSILASIYNTMNERRREFAILRALGAKRRTVFAAIVLEAAVIALLGVLVGYFVYGGILAVAASIIRQETGVAIDLWRFHPVFLWLPLLMLGLGALAGLLPARKAYSTDVASNLVPSS